MKTIIPVVLLLGAGSASLAQNIPPATTPEAAVVGTPIRPLSDSTRQAVHKLFKWGRLCGAVGALSGGIVAVSEVRYIARRGDNWTTGVNLATGAGAIAFGTVTMVRFSRKRENQVLASLEQGQPLPPDVAVWLPLVRADGQRKKK